MNNNLIKYNEVFKKVFGEKIKSFEDFSYSKGTIWDSMAQIALVSSIEDTFNLEWDMDDIFEFQSYKKGMEILEEKFKINFS